MKLELITKNPDQNEIINKTARDLADGKAVGWFQGRMEFDQGL